MPHHKHCYSTYRDTGRPSANRETIKGENDSSYEDDDDREFEEETKKEAQELNNTELVSIYLYTGMWRAPIYAKEILSRMVEQRVSSGKRRGKK